MGKVLTDDFFIEEVICGYTVTEKAKKVRAVQLDLIEKFKEVCDNYNLTYFVMYGTLLGAVRHNGYIPWDDDVDITMPREDYEKLRLISDQEFKDPYFFQTPENEPDFFIGGASRLRNSNTTGIELMHMGHDCNAGIWLDITVLDKTYDDESKRRSQIQKIKFYQRLILAKIYKRDDKKCLDLQGFKWKFYCIISIFLKHQWLCKQLNRYVTLCKDTGTESLAIFTQYTNSYEYQVYNPEDFEEKIMINFEYMKLPAPIGYKRLLKTIFGSDYMKYPPLVERKPGHKGVFYTDVPYEICHSRITKAFKNIDNKKVVIFGAGRMFNDYMKKYGYKYTPEFIVDNNEQLWGTKRNGIEIKNPMELLKINSEDLRLIICNIYYQDIEKQLNNMGICEFYFYVQEKEWLCR